MIIDSKLFLDDFESEAKIHIETIETAFLDVKALTDDISRIDHVFRAAHSIKGTAGFFQLEKIVTVSHELESVFTLIKEGVLEINDEIADLTLQSVDCLKDLVNFIQDDSNIDITKLIKALKHYSTKNNSEENNQHDIYFPFDINDPYVKKTLKNSMKRGHKLYYVNIGFNRSLGKYYKNPEGMISNILSIGDITETIVGGDHFKRTDNTNTVTYTSEVSNALRKIDTTTLEILVTSVLDFDLFSMAVEVDKRHIISIPEDKIFDNDKNESPEEDISKSTVDKSGTTKENSSNGFVYAKASSQKNDFSIRLDIDVINHLLDLSGEMILSRNRLFSILANHEKSISGLNPILHDINRLTGDIQERVMLTRMQPVSTIFSKFPRIIRDMSKALDKDIELEISGGDISLDKYLLESLTDPITQIIKNSADHGLESTSRRSELNKPPKGKIKLNAYMIDDTAVVEIADDGIGIDAKALIQKGLKNGIITEDDVKSMTINDVYELMFKPGISTTENVTNLSGRGVGMDIVKTNIEKLGGSIEIDSEINIGTTVRLKLPISLSVIRTLIVKINSCEYAVPEVNVELILRIKRDNPSRRIERLNNRLVLNYDGNAVPLITIDEIDAKAKGQNLMSPEKTLKKINQSDVNKCLLLKTHDRIFALLIDEAVETEQILLKPLPEFFINCLCYSGLTVLGNGNAITVLNADGILRLMEIEGIPSGFLFNGDKNYDKDSKQIIVFKCSGSEYFALDTNEIARIDVIPAGHIQEVGSSQYTNVAGETIRIIRPENFAPVKKRRYTEQKLYIITLKNSSPPVGFLAGQLLDKIEDDFKLDKDQLISEFIYGTCAYNEKILIFLDPTAISKKLSINKRKTSVKKG